MRGGVATLAECLGVGLVVYGAWLVSRPAGFILGGVMVVVIANIADVKGVRAKRSVPDADA